MAMAKSKRSPATTNSPAKKKKPATVAAKKLAVGKPKSDLKMKKSATVASSDKSKAKNNEKLKSVKSPKKAKSVKSPKKTKSVKSPKKAKSVKSPEKAKSVKSPKKAKSGKQIFNKTGLAGNAAANQSHKRQVKRALELNRGVVYFSHLPHGFYENELKDYCSQFGLVTGVYVPRNRAGNSKGYAFVEFKHPEVAGVVAETMNNYLMFDRLVKATLVPVEKQKPYIFERSRKVNPVLTLRKRAKKAVELKEKILSPKEEEKRKKITLKKIQKIHDQLKAKGLDYEFEVAS